MSAQIVPAVQSFNFRSKGDLFMLNRRASCFLALLLTIVFATIAGVAQVQNGSVIGTVTDPSGAVLPHAQVTALSVTTGTHFVTVTTASGEYVFPSLPIGRYTISARLHGFKTSVRSEIPVEVGQRQAVNFNMQLGSVVQTVQVTSSVPPLETQSASPGLVVVNRYVQDLPLSIRNWDDLMGLSAGVSADRYTNQSGATNSGRYGGINIHGVRSLQNDFILDGVDNNTVSENVQELSTESVRPSVDAIAEFKMVTDPYDAEYGRSPGGAVVVVTKSGTNQFHGDVWEFNRTSATDATDFFTNRAGASKPVLTQNQFGGVVGGPIIKNKLFFMFNYEGTRIGQGVTRLTNVPLPSERAGDFSPAAGGGGGCHLLDDCQSGYWAAFRGQHHSSEFDRAGSHQVAFFGSTGEYYCSSWSAEPGKLAHQSEADG
jgi:hypothetical protein